jgi:hypothetical protein
MIEIIGLGVLSLILVVVALSIWFIKSRNTRLDKAYHDALHAESVEDFALATQLYESILEKHGAGLDTKVRYQIQQRIDTMRHQKEYLKGFGQKDEVASKPERLVERYTQS